MPEETKTDALPVKQPETALAPVQKSYPMREMLTILKETGDAELFRSFAHDIIEREVAQSRFGQDAQLARTFAESGAFDGISGTNQGVALAMTKIQLGRSWNMAVSDAMKSLFFINGRPSVESSYLAAKMQDAGLSWDIAWDQDKDGTCTGCHLHLKRWNPDTKKYDPITGAVNGVTSQAVVSFTKRNADNAMVFEGGKKIRLSEKFNYQSWGEDMYFARCVSRVRTRYAPNVLSGVMTREESEDAGDGSKPSGAEVKTLEKAADISDRIRQQKALSAVPAATAQTKASPAPAAAAEPPAPGPTVNVPAAAPAQPAAPAPKPAVGVTWSDRTSMNSAFKQQQERIGRAAFDALVSKNGIMFGSLKHDDPKAGQFYADLVGYVVGSAAAVEDVF
jgi:hypothetical protein